MKRSAPANPKTAPVSRLQPDEAHARLALREARTILEPLALWAIRNGVAYTAFAEMLKAVFVHAARAELDRTSGAITQSAISLLSGVHRKDVRTLSAGETPRRAQPRPSVPSQVYTHWLADKRWRDRRGKPRPLPRTGEAGSFEALCRSLSNDVHPRAVLDELLRLGLVALQGERVVPVVRSFVPAADIEELTQLFAANAADHLAAAVSNLTAENAAFLEQSIFADGLRPESVEALHSEARAAWARSFQAVVTKARQRVEEDRHSDGEQRVRFGVYFYSESAAIESKARLVEGPRGRPKRKSST
jgi:hypothetical protein